MVLRTLGALTLYAMALLFIWTALSIAPVLPMHGTWNDAQIVGAHFLVIGLCAKFFGHCVLLRVI